MRRKVKQCGMCAGMDDTNVFAAFVECVGHGYTFGRQGFEFRRRNDAAADGRHPVRPENRKVVQRFAPVMNRHSPLFRRLAQGQEQQLQRGFSVGEATASE